MTPAPAPSPAPAPQFVRSADDAAALFAGLGDGGVECAAVLFLDPERRLLARADFRGSIDRVVPPLRAIIGQALQIDAAALILAHGHPSGVAAPSAADIAYTRELGRVAAAVDLALLDHLIFAGRRMTSLRAMGLL